MQALKQFIQEGNTYKLKPQYGFNIILIAGLFGITFLGIFLKEPMVYWIFGVLGALVSFNVFTKSLIIDLDKNEIIAKIVLLRPQVVVPINAINNFELYSIKQNFITTNAAVNVYYLKDGKEKQVQLAQGFTVSSMQYILNEMEEILENATTKR